MSSLQKRIKEFLAEEKTLKHLLGKHDQKTHGRRRAISSVDANNPAQHNFEIDKSILSGAQYSGKSSYVSSTNNYNEKKELKRVASEGFSRGRKWKETIGEWLKLHEIERTPQGLYVLYHATTKVGGAKTGIRKGSYMISRPEDAIFYAKRDRELKGKDIVLHRLELRPSEIDPGIFPTLMNNIEFNN